MSNVRKKNKKKKKEKGASVILPRVHLAMMNAQAPSHIARDLCLENHALHPVSREKPKELHRTLCLENTILTIVKNQKRGPARAQ